MMVFATIIPTSLNDGSPVSPAELSQITRTLWERFGGATMEGQVEGHWVDEQTGQHYQDTGIKVSVATSRERLGEAIETVKEIGRQLDQKAMFFEVRYYDGVQILRID